MSVWVVVGIVLSVAIAFYTTNICSLWVSFSKAAGTNAAREIHTVLKSIKRHD